MAWTHRVSNRFQGFILIPSRINLLHRKTPKNMQSGKKTVVCDENNHKASSPSREVSLDEPE